MSCACSRLHLVPLLAVLFALTGAPTRAGVVARAARELAGRLGARSPGPLARRVMNVPARKAATRAAPTGGAAVLGVVRRGPRPAGLAGGLGPGAGRALQVLGPRQGRRLRILAADGTLARLGRTDDLLAVITHHGDRAMDFVWRHKGALAVSTVLASFLADPGPFLDGSRALAGRAASAATRPIADALGRRLARLEPDARTIGVASLGLLAALALGKAIRDRRPRRPQGAR